MNVDDHSISETENGKEQPPIECRYGYGKDVPDKKSRCGNGLLCTK